MTAVTLDRPSYDEDFHAWALDHAERLRALARTRPNEPIDWEQVAEELEDMGRRERRGAEAYLKLIILHLLKLEYARDAVSARHWRAEIAAFRKNLARLLTPSLQTLLPGELAGIYELARAEALATTGGDPDFDDRAPDQCPYSWEQIIGDWLPERLGA